jgi:hypothetical protein
MWAAADGSAAAAAAAGVAAAARVLRRLAWRAMLLPPVLLGGALCGPGGRTQGGDGRTALGQAQVPALILRSLGRVRWQQGAMEVKAERERSRPAHSSHWALTRSSGGRSGPL